MEVAKKRWRVQKCCKFKCRVRYIYISKWSTMTLNSLARNIVLSKFSILSFHGISLNKETSYNNRQTQFKPMVQFISKINRNVGNFGRNFVWIFSKIWITLLCVIIFWNYLSRSSKKNLSFLIRSIDRYEGINDLIVWKIIRIYIYI